MDSLSRKVINKEVSQVQNFMWWNPTIVFFGKGTIPNLVEQLSAMGAKSVLLLYGGKAVFKNGAYAQLTQALTKAGITFPEIGGVKSNPRIDKVREAIARVKASPVDAIVPLGGGSVFVCLAIYRQEHIEAHAGMPIRIGSILGHLQPVGGLAYLFDTTLHAI